MASNIIVAYPFFTAMMSMIAPHAASLATANTVGSFWVANSLAQYLDFSLCGSSTNHLVSTLAPVASASATSQSVTALLLIK